MSQPLRARSNLSSSRASSDLLMQRSRPNRTTRPSRDSAYEEEADAALRTAMATEELGIRTAIKLKEQTEQMRYIEDKIAVADLTLVSTNRSLRSMESFSGRLRNLFSRSNPKTDIQIRKKQDAKVVAKEAKASEKSRAKQEKALKTEHLGSLGAADEQLDMISESVRNIRFLAEDMNVELTTQNRMLSGIGRDVHSLEVRLQKQNQQINRLR